MRASVRKLGNSSGIIVPTSILDEIGVAEGDWLDITLLEGRIVLTPAERRARAGWAEASREIAASGENTLAWPEFGNAGDDDLVW